MFVHINIFDPLEQFNIVQYCSWSSNISTFMSIVFLIFTYILFSNSVGLIPYTWEFNDASVPWQIGFQDPATPIMEGIIDLHHDIMFFIIVIIVFVSWLLFKLSYTYKVPYEANSLVWAGWWIPRSFKVHNTFLETVWTIIPSAILILISIPSFILLYAADLDSVYINAQRTPLPVTVVGRQWYWEYQRPYIIQDSNKVKIIKFDSYMLAEEYLNKKKPYRLLEVDNSLLFVQEPGEVYFYTLKVTSGDVLHSWALPSFGIKLDACPGRINKTSFSILRHGVFNGQCSKICGLNYNFMPVLQARSAYEKDIAGFGYPYAGIHPKGVMVDYIATYKSSESKKFLSWEKFFADEKRVYCPYCVLGVGFSFLFCGNINDYNNVNNSLEYLFLNKYSLYLCFFLH